MLVHAIFTTTTTICTTNLSCKGCSCYARNVQYMFDLVMWTTRCETQVVQIDWAPSNNNNNNRGICLEVIIKPVIRDLWDLKYVPFTKLITWQGN